MSVIPKTSITLLKDLAGSPECVRWTEFYERYEQAMRGFLRTRFPSVEADDVLQETMLALSKALPGYRYTPDTNGHFRNYLMGVVRHKAMDALNANARRARTRERMLQAVQTDAPVVEDEDHEEAAWRLSLMESAVEQLMADDTLTPVTREVFRHVALLHEEPAKVAADFGLTRNNVDQIKRRLVVRLSTLVRDMSNNV